VRYQGGDQTAIINKIQAGGFMTATLLSHHDWQRAARESAACHRALQSPGSPRRVATPLIEWTGLIPTLDNAFSRLESWLRMASRKTGDTSP
jgi:hypothetical protein